MLCPVRAARVALHQVRRASRLRLRVTHRKCTSRDFRCKPYRAVTQVSTNIIWTKSRVYLQEQAKSQTINAARDRRLEDSAFFLARYVLPAFRAPFEDVDGRSVELECGFYVVSNFMLEKCPNHPPPSHKCQLTGAMAWLCNLTAL